MQQVHIERLRDLYAIMAGIPDDVVDLDTWRQCNYDDERLKSCGTTACAVGWACAYPGFQAEGLFYDGCGPRFAVLESWSAVEAFFGLSAEEAEDLFYNHNLSNTLELDYNGPDGTYYPVTDRQRVLMRIRRFLMKKGVITAERNAELALQDGAPA